MGDQVTWDQVSTPEQVSEDDIKNSESSGRPPAGKYITVIESTKPKQINPKDKPSYYAATLIHKIEEVIELGGKPVSGEEGDQYIGRKIFDDVSLAHPNEADAVRNRRICIVKRAGIISDSSTEIPSNTWSDLIIEKRFLVEVIKEDYKDKHGNPKSTTKIAMFGYNTPESAVQVSDADLDDI
jgi:hypothetical protein